MLEDTTMSTTITDRRIKNLDDFEAATTEPRQIAGLYFFQLLDCLLDLVYEVSVDYYDRPQLYRDLGEPELAIAAALARLNAKYGSDIDFLSAGQRRAIYSPIFGSWNGSTSNGNDSFRNLRDALIHAATAFAELAVGSGIDMLRENVRQAHRPFKDYLVSLQGDSVRFSKIDLGNLTEKNFYPILRNQGVAAVFGIAKLQAPDYPYATDGSEDLLVEQISKQLSTTQSLKAQPVITREQISNLQRAALRGTEAIATAIDFEESNAQQTIADLDLLILKCYTWGTALEALNGPLKSPQSPMQPVSARSAGGLSRELLVSPRPYAMASSCSWR